MLWELGHWALCRDVSRTCRMWLEVGSRGKSTADAKYNKPVYLAKMWKRLMLISPSVKTEVFLHSFKHQKLRKSCLRVSSRCTRCSLSLSYLDILFQVCSHPLTSLCVKTWIFGVVVSNASKGIFFWSQADVDLKPPLSLVVVVEFLSHVWLFTTPWTAARQSSLSLFPGVCSDSCSLSWWYSLTISSSTDTSSFAFSLSQHQGLWMIQLFASVTF